MNQRNQDSFDTSEKDKEKEKADEQFKELLKVSKVIRDPIHGDIWVTELEKDIIDTPCFQRLRKIRQLGSSHLIYPGANHTRFEHSLGALFLAEYIIFNINRTYDYSYDDKTKYSDIKLTPQDKFLIRLIALLHDSAHTSFGHTLEGEGNLFNEHQMKHAIRRNYVIENIFPIIKKHLTKHKVEDVEINEILGEEFSDKSNSGCESFSNDINNPNPGLIEKILIAEEEGDEKKIMELEKPYIADIVGNTICADLLDYLKRDAYYTGLQATYDTRLFAYFCIKDYAWKQKEGSVPVNGFRLAILLESKREDSRGYNIRRDVLSTCVDLLSLRYSIAEKVYYHRVKTIVSAMVINCIHRAKRGGFFNEAKKGDEIDSSGWRKLMLLGDDALISEIANHNLDNTVEGHKKNDLCAAKKIAVALQKRKLFAVIPLKEKFDDNYWNLIKHYYEKPEKRYEFERLIEKIFDFKNGSIIIYITRKDEGKAAKVKTFIKSKKTQVLPLDELGKKYKKEFEFRSIKTVIDTINKRYSLLWKFYVLLDKTELTKELTKVPTYKLKFKDLSTDIISVCNELINKKTNKSYQHIVRVRTKIFEKKHKIKIPMKDQKEICQSLKDYSNSQPIEEIEKLLDNYAKKNGLINPS